MIIEIITNSLTEDTIEELLDLEVAIVDSNNQTKLYFEDNILETVKEILIPYSTTINNLSDENWVQKSQANWDPINFDKFSISLVTEKKEAKDNEILIIPGTGFGTGQHATTNMILNEISNLEIEPKNILDFGCGSAILSIACANIFNAKILACDNDPLAIENAKDNLEINGKSSKIELKISSLENIEVTFDLILANIYADVLWHFSKDLINKLSDDGHIILSGILPEKSSLVEDAYSSLKLVKKLLKDNWVMLYYKR